MASGVLNGCSSSTIQRVSLLRQTPLELPAIRLEKLGNRENRRIVLRFSAARARKHCSAFRFVSPGSLRLHVVLFSSVCFLSGCFPPRLATTVFGPLFLASSSEKIRTCHRFAWSFKTPTISQPRAGLDPLATFASVLSIPCAEAGLDISACGAGDRRISALKKKYDECSLFFLRCTTAAPNDCIVPCGNSLSVNLHCLSQEGLSQFVYSKGRWGFKEVKRFSRPFTNKFLMMLGKLCWATMHHNPNDQSVTDWPRILDQNTPSFLLSETSRKSSCM